MAERFGQPPGITQGDMGPRYTRKRLADEVYVGHYIKAGDRIRVRSTILTGVIASLTTVNLTIGGRVQGMDGDLVPFGDSFTLTADGAQTAQYVMAPEGYVVDLIVQSTSTGLVSGDLTVIVDIVQGTGSNAVAVGLLAYGYVYPAGLLGLNVSRNIGGGSGGGMAIGGAVTGGTAKSILFLNAGPVLAQDNANLQWDDAANQLIIGGGLIPVGTAPITISAGNDGFGDATLIIDNATDGYVPIRCPQLLVIQSPEGVQVFSENSSSTDCGDVRVIAGTGSGAGHDGGSAHLESGAADGHAAAVLVCNGATDAAHGTVTMTINSVIQARVTTAALALNVPVQLPGVAIASLPAAPIIGMVLYVTDALTPVWGATVGAGGSAKTLVWYNGANWTVIGV